MQWAEREPGRGAVPAGTTHTGRPGRQRTAIGLAFAASAPGLVIGLGRDHPTGIGGAALFGIAIVGAAFLLAWAAEALQLDVSQGLALALLALIAVLPEYVVDFTFAHKAGQDPHRFAPLALANMTGSNRLLIGVGWTAVVLIAAWRLRRTARERGDDTEPNTEVHLARSHSIEIGFLAVATAYSLTLPLKSHLTLFDAGVLVALYLAYVWRISRAPAEAPHLVGPAQLIGALPTRRRRVVVGAMLAYAAGVILVGAEPFADALVSTGRELGISTFLLVQWLAPLASEAPELLIACLFAWRLNTDGGLGTLVSSKVNQWTLLVGTLPIVFVIAGGASSGLPLDRLQREELFLTAAQSAFAVAILANRSISVREAWSLFTLFAAQFVLGGVLPTGLRHWERLGVGIAYLVLGAGILIKDRGRLRTLTRDAFRTPVRELAPGNSAGNSRGNAPGNPLGTAPEAATPRRAP